MKKLALISALFSSFCAASSLSSPCFTDQHGNMVDKGQCNQEKIWRAACEVNEWGNATKACSEEYLLERGADLANDTVFSNTTDDMKVSDVWHYMLLDRPRSGHHEDSNADYYVKLSKGGASPDGAKGNSAVHIAHDIMLNSDSKRKELDKVTNQLKEVWILARHPRAGDVKSLNSEPAFQFYKDSKFFEDKIKDGDQGVMYIPRNEGMDHVNFDFRPCSIFGSGLKPAYSGSGYVDECLDVFTPYSYESKNAIGYPLCKGGADCLRGDYAEVAKNLQLTSDGQFNAVWLGRLQTYGREYPFKLEAAYINVGTTQASSGNIVDNQVWQEVKNPAGKGAKFIDYAGKEGAFIAIDHYGNAGQEKHYRSRIGAGFHPLNCREDAIYKITTADKNLHIYGTETYNSDKDGEVFHMIYHNPRVKAVCRNPENYGDNYYLHVSQNGGGYIKTGHVCTGLKYAWCGGDLAHCGNKEFYPFVIHKFTASGLFLNRGGLGDEKGNITWFVKIPGDAKYPSCAQLKTTGQFFTLSEGQNAYLSDTGLSDPKSLNAHEGILLRLSGKSAGYRFDLKDANGVKYLIIDPKKSGNTMKLRMNDSVSIPIVTREDCSLKPNDDYCKLKTELGFSDHAAVYAVSQLDGGSKSYVCSDINAEYCSVAGDKLRFFLVFDKLDVGQKIDIYVADGGLGTATIANNLLLPSRAEKFNFAPVTVLDAPFKSFGKVALNAGMKNALVDYPSMAADGKYTLGDAMYRVWAPDGSEYRFYDSNLGEHEVDATKDASTEDGKFGNNLGFFASARWMYYTVKDRTVEKLFGRSAQDYCAINDVLDPEEANKVNGSGKITCHVPGRSKIEINPDAFKLRASIHFDEFGGSNVLLANNNKTAMQVDFAKRAYDIDAVVASGKECISVDKTIIKPHNAADLGRCDVLVGDWSDVSAAAVELANNENFKLEFNHDAEVSPSMKLQMVESDTASDAPENFVLDKDANNAAFIAALDRACWQSSCEKLRSGRMETGISNKSRALMRDVMLGTKETRSVNCYANERSKISAKSASFNKLAMPAGSGVQSMKLNFFDPIKIKKFDTYFHGARIGVVDAVMMFDDIQSNADVVSILPGAAKLYYPNASGALEKINLETSKECPAYTGAQPCYSEFNAGNLAFEENSRRINLASQYNNKVEYIPDSEWKIYKKGKAKYQKDILNCIDGNFKCADFSVEFKK